MTIPKANSTFGSSITCEVTNEYGSITKTCDLVILGMKKFYFIKKSNDRIYDK